MKHPTCFFSSASRENIQEIGEYPPKSGHVYWIFREPVVSKQNCDAQAVFFAALDLISDEEQDAFVDQACGDNDELRGRVVSLLSAHRDAGRFLGGPHGSELDTMDTAGSTIDRYRLMQW